MFNDVFVDVECEFCGVFIVLFFGGEGWLWLIEFDDMFIIGIEVEVCLLGKKII